MNPLSDLPRFDDLVRACTARGMNLVGAVDAAEFDATQPCGRRAVERMPDCGMIVLLGSGGRSAWQSISRHHGRLGAARPGHHPIDGWSREVAEGVADALRSAGCGVSVVDPDERRPMNFRQLAEAVGFGTISPVIGQLLHPVYGPWVSLRVALLVSGRPFGPIAAAPLIDFEPCCGCSRPCVQACPAGVYRDEGRQDLLRCATWRVDGNCETGCDTLVACPVGSAHRYDDDELRFRHAHSLFRIRRWVGAGAWRFVPRFLRQWR